MSAETMWAQGFTAAEIARRTGQSEATVRTYARRHGWKRTLDGELRLQRYLSESGNRGNAERWLGWPPMRGSPEDRDRQFVRALALEIQRHGWVTR